MRGITYVDESLVEIGDVFVSQARTALAAVFKATLELGEETEMTAEMPIGMKKIAQQEIALASGGSAPNPEFS